MSRIYVPPSSDTLFIRGFSYHHRVDDIKDFFAKEAGRCAVEFNKDDGNNGQYIALRFESREIAKDVYRRFNDRDVLGDRITLTWYKDLRRIKTTSDPRRYPSRRDSYYGSDQYEHRDRGSYQGSGRSSYYKGHYPQTTSSSGGGVGRLRRYSRSSSRSRSISRSVSRSRSSSRSYESGEVRGPKSRSSSLGPPKRYKLKGEDRKKLKHQRRLKRAANEYDSSDSLKRKLKKSQKKMKKINSAITNSGEGGGDVNQKDGLNDSTMEQSIEKSNSTKEQTQGDNNDKTTRPNVNKMTKDNEKNDDKDDGLISDDYDGQILDDDDDEEEEPPRQQSQIQKPPPTLQKSKKMEVAATTTSQSTKHLNRLLDSNINKQQLNSNTKYINLDQNEDSMDVDADFPNFIENIEVNIPTNDNELQLQQKQQANTANVINKNKEDFDKGNQVQDMTKKQQQRLKAQQNPIKLSDEKLKLLRDKKEEVEKAYKQDCETIVMVTKLLVSKDPLLEERIQKSLRENLRDIGHRCVQELREFVDRIKNNDGEDVEAGDDNDAGVDGGIKAN